MMLNLLLKTKWIPAFAGMTALLMSGAVVRVQPSLQLFTNP
jgi:hypothetical protein